MPARLLNWIKAHKLLLAGAALLLALCLTLTLIGGARDRHRIHAVWDETRHTLRVEQEISLTNRTGTALDHVCLNLYSNAYAREDTAPVLAGDRNAAYPDGFSPGGAVVQSVCVNGDEAPWTLEGGQGTLLHVELPFALRPQGSVELTLCYEVTLPFSRLRMGYSARDVRLCNVFATVALFDGGDFRADAYGPVGDPFVSECADWDVTLETPQSYVVAGPGLQEKTDDGTWTFRGRDLRDFALVMSRDYCVAQADWDGVTVRTFAFSQEGAEHTLAAACRALTVYSDLYGRYPYPDFTVCAAEFFVGGMEFPSMAMIDTSLYEVEDGMLEFVTAHETAHQWWYAAVGSDQVRHPWQDEALAEYSTLLYYESIYGAQSFDSLYQARVRPATETAALRGVGVDQALERFESAAVYDALVYRKGAAMLHDLRASMGNEAFIAALRRYYEDNLHSIAAPTQFFEALGPESASRAAAWLRGETP